MTLWKVVFTNKAAKQAGKFNLPILSVLRLLVEELATKGPSAVLWPNFGKLHGKKNEHMWHCHLGPVPKVSVVAKKQEVEEKFHKI